MAKNSTKVQDLFVSVVVVAKSEVSELADFVKRLSKQLSMAYANYEILVIDNHAPQAEVAAVHDLLTELPCIRLIRLSRQYNHDTAIFTGLEAAIGDFVVVMDPIIDPLSELVKIVEANKNVDIT
jgi:polyisoprenyl-phosphate glycosyltransferase